MTRFLTDEGARALTRATAGFEAVTAAELVVVVRPRAAGYLHVGVIVGVTLALAVQAFLLYGEPEFDLHWFLVAPLVVGLGTGALAGAPAVQRRLTRPATRERAALAAARAAFVDHRVADTRGRTGILLYVAVAERLAVLLPDLGVRQAVPEPDLARAEAELRAAVARGAPATALAAALAPLAELCARHLPRGEDDADELPNEVMS
jgi:putative membrane protein